MMNISIDMIKQLRKQTGAGVLDCRKALEQSSQNMEAALAYLRERAVGKAEKQAHREALHGKLEVYEHGDGRIGVMVEIHTETDFSRRSDAFRNFSREIALQITAACPLYIRDEDIPQNVLNEQAQVAAESALQAGKPDKIIERIVQGTVEKYKDKHVLLRQPYLRDESITIAELLSQAIGSIGENIVIRRFVRWEVAPASEEEQIALPG